MLEPNGVPHVQRILGDLLLPVRCVVCGAGEQVVCVECAEALVRIREPVCERCGAPTAWPVSRCRQCPGFGLPFSQVRSAVLYEASAPALVRAWKERGQRGLTSMLAELVERAVRPPDAEALTVVPGDAGRNLWRGHHAAAELARELTNRWSIPFGMFLKRRPGQPRQRGLSGAARRHNLKEAFEVVAAPPARVVLVDDVLTTGATVTAAARELQGAGTVNIEVVTLARVIRR